MKEVIKINLSKNSYDIVIKPNLLDNISSYLSNIAMGKKIIIVTDSNVEKLYLKKVSQSLTDNNFIVHSITIPAGESSKSFKYMEYICNKALDFKIDRNSTLLALGGGVVGDITGFCASSLLRGINFIQVPTTLLSQVDSSVGGKTAINSVSGKNLIGSFYQPKIVLIDPNVLLDLPQRHINSGYGEVVKYTLLNDINFFNKLNSGLTKKILNRDIQSLITAISYSVKAKANIVAQDEKEKNIRALLNLGHTFAHVLENITNYSDSLFHGEAVCIGTCMASTLSHQLGYITEEQKQMVINHFKNNKLPYSIDKLKIDHFKTKSLIELIKKDKKTTNNSLNLILFKQVGNCIIEKNVPIEQIKKTLSIYGFSN